MASSHTFLNKEINMSRIPIIERQSKPLVPSNKELYTEQPRYRNTGKPPLAIDKSYSPQAKKQREN